MLTQDTLQFLRDLSKNNNREWFHTNKKRYEKELKNPWKQFIQEVIDHLAIEDPSIQIPSKDAVFRIARDTRFSKDKTPYKTNVGALISAEGRRAKEKPGMYIHLEPGMLMLGGGAYFMEKETLYKLRKKIVEEPDRFVEIISNPTFVRHYETVKGAKNKRLPKEFAEAAVAQPLLFNKQFYYMSEHPGTTILQEDIINIILEHYRAGKPLSDFVREAMD